MNPLPRSFYDPSAEVVARALLGHVVARREGGGVCTAIIVETEAYLHDDPACHAFSGLTRRNAPMFGHPGHAYVYFIYGNHFCLNAVCRPEGVGEAVLVRAVQPVDGMESMLRRRPVEREHELTSGPGKLCMAMGLNRSHNGIDLCDAASEVFIARNPGLEKTLESLGPVVETTRIGLTKAAQLPLRYYLDGSRFVSKRARPKS